MLLPLLLIGLATGAAAVLAYGTHPGLLRYERGLEMIMLTRRLEWPLIAVSLLFCLVLLGLVISNKRRAWWLLGLAPVLALFVHRFAPSSAQRMYVVDFAESNQQLLPSDDSWVVGMVFEDRPYALPFSALYNRPVVFVTDFDKRVVVMWSAYANRAVAFRTARDLRPRDLEVVASPHDTLLVYDRRLGQFIIALTGQTPTGQKPIGLGAPVSVFKMTWGDWHKRHPTTKLMSGFEATNAPAKPILPSIAGTAVDGTTAETRIAMIPSTQPTALLSDSIANQPVNTVVGQTRVLLLRDPATQQLSAFDRNVQSDLFPRFTPKTNPKIPQAALIDADTNSLWSRDGKAVDGLLKGTQMKSIPIEDDLYWGVMKKWYPDLTVQK